MDTTHDDLCRTDAGKYGVICLCDLIRQAEQRGRDEASAEHSADWERTSRSGVPVRVSLTASPKED